MKEIPALTGLEPQVQKPLEAIKENLETLTGRRGTKIKKLGPTSTLADAINKINELIGLLQP